ncbi:MAG: hypothetical protein ACKN9U_04255, partial [Pirellulaceae bacterium]
MPAANHQVRKCQSPVMRRVQLAPIHGLTPANRIAAARAFGKFNIDPPPELHGVVGSRPMSAYKKTGKRIQRLHLPAAPIPA